MVAQTASGVNRPTVHARVSRSLHGFSQGVTQDRVTIFISTRSLFFGLALRRFRRTISQMA